MNMARNFSLSPTRLAMAARLALAGGSLVLLAAVSACGGAGSPGLVDDPIVNPPPPPPPPATQVCPDGSVIPVTDVCPSPPPPPPPASTGTLAVNPTTCVIVAVDTSTCPAPVSLMATVQNGTGAVAIKLPDGSTISPGTNVPVAPPPLGETSYLLVDGSRELARASITVSGDSSLVEKDGKCTAPPLPAPLRYSVIMGMPSGSVGLPARITGDTCATAKVEEAKNETSYPEVYVNFALYNSMLHTTITPSGLVFGTSQVVAESGKTMSFHYNPVTNKWTNDDGSLGTAPKYTPFAERDAGWVFQSAADHPDPNIGGWAQNENMLVYVTRGDGNRPLCEDIVGGVRSGLPVVLDVSHDDFGTWFGFWHFKN